MSEVEQYIKYRLTQIEISDGDFTNIDFFIKTSNTDGFSTALEFAACYGREDIVVKLVEIGANINHNNSAPFRMACTSGHLSIVEYFMSIGNLVKDDLTSVIADTLDNDHVDVVRYLLSDLNVHLFDINYSYDYALRMAIQKNLLDIASILLKFGANINVLDGYLMDIAIGTNNQSIIQFLIKHGIDSKYIPNS